MLIAHALVAALALTAPAQTALPFPTGKTQTINILEWDTNQLPKIYERSDQLPLTDAEVAKLANAGFTSAQLVKIIEERRCACDASADGLIRLKEQGVPGEVLSAISLHALKPNRALALDVTLDFTGKGNQAREAYLYAFVDDGELTRVLSLNVGDLLGRRNAHESLVDQSDILLTRKVRRIRLVGDLPLKTYGPHTVLVATSANPTLTHPSQLSAQERKNAQTYKFDYPRSSIQSVCRLNAGYKRDPVLAYKWRFMGSRFECEWN
jgi:hypothetical protein